MCVTIENAYLLARIEARGGELTRLQDKANGRELLWTGDPAFWSYHSPVLFPFVGKHFGGAFRFRGKTYLMGQHGFARTSTFKLKRQEAAFAAFTLVSDGQTRAQYPFDFELTVSYRLEGRNLQVSWEVFNPDREETLLFQIGAHPAFRVPLKEGEKKSDYMIRFHDDPAPSYILIDLEAGAAEPDRRYRMETEAGCLRIREHLFDIDTFVFEEGQIKKISLCTPDGTPYVTVSCAGFPHFGIWSPSDAAPFVCLEPWYGRLDNRGFDGELDRKVGIQKLAPGARFAAAYTISVP